MIEKILKNSYVNPKVELTESDYNRLVSMAQMKARNAHAKSMSRKGSQPSGSQAM